MRATTPSRAVRGTTVSSVPEGRTSSVAPPGPAPEGMVWIPGGDFVMGTDDPESYEHERPAHNVRVSGFWMDKYLVTKALWDEVNDRRNEFRSDH